MTSRALIRKGLRVEIILKKDQGSSKLTNGIVSEILTNSSNHPRGIKVRLESGQVGRVRIIGSSVINEAFTNAQSEQVAYVAPVFRTQATLSDYIVAIATHDAVTEQNSADWGCDQCTFHNSEFLQHCEICGSEKQN